jgi:hypothetical protein
MQQECGCETMTINLNGKKIYAFSKICKDHDLGGKKHLECYAVIERSERFPQD